MLDEVTLSMHTLTKYKEKTATPVTEPKKKIKEKRALVHEDEINTILCNVATVAINLEKNGLIKNRESIIPPALQKYQERISPLINTTSLVNTP